MATSEDTVTESLDFSLCLICQGVKYTDVNGTRQREKLTSPGDVSYHTLLRCISDRAQYKNRQYVIKTDNM